MPAGSSLTKRPEADDWRLYMNLYYREIAEALEERSRQFEVIPARPGLDDFYADIAEAVRERSRQIEDTFGTLKMGDLYADIAAEVQQRRKQIEEAEIPR
jgi:hypothetical protein